MSKKKHLDYWTARQEEILQYLDSADLDIAKELTDVYSEQALQAQKDLYRLYMQYAEDHNMTYQEAQQRLRHVDLSDYRENAARYRKQAEKDPELLKRLNEQYVASKATRLDALALDMTFRVGLLKHAVEKSFERYLKDSASYAYQKAMGGRPGTINGPALEQLTKTPFNGYNYSQQLWGNVDNLARDLKEALRRGFVRGDGPKEIARELAKRFDVAKHRAVTLVRTDGTMVANKATAQRYMDAGFLYYRDLVRLDSRTTDICREIAGEDERKLLSEMEIGVNAAPYHYNCRTTIILDEEELDGVDSEMPRMFRNKDYNKRRPVNIVRQNKLTHDFRQRGGKIWQDDESEQYLKSRKAAAMNLGSDLIVLQKKATISEILEELYHADQWRDGRLVDETVSKIKAEIEAQNYLLSVKKRYNIPKAEVDQTKRNLEYWREELRKYESK